MRGLELTKGLYKRLEEQGYRSKIVSITHYEFFAGA